VVFRVPPGVVEHHVETAERVHRRREHGLDVIRLGNVGVHGDRGLADLGSRGLLVPADVRAHDLGALLREQQRRGPAHARPRAGDDGDLALKLSHYTPFPVNDVTALTP
jgi:hypothetical protein